MKNDLATAIIKTLVYADLFDYPLTAAEIHRYLIHHQSVPQSELGPHLKKALDAGQIKKVQDVYLFPGREAIASLRRKRRLISNRKKAKVVRLMKIFQSIPALRAVFITGALSMDNGTETDDIDIMVITAPHRLWTTRFFTTLALDSLRVRRRPRMTRTNNLICANLYLDETALQISPENRNLYTAHEVVQAQPLLDKANLHERFLTANAWVADFLPNTSLPPSAPAKTTRPPHLPIPESLFYQFQYQYMKPKITRERVTPHAAFFHPRNTGARILRAYHRRLEEVLSL